MANNIFANGMELACKSGSGKVTAAMPDVCFIPPDKVPPTPLGVPIPHPNNTQADKTYKGTKSVKITNKPAMLENKSYFKSSMGNEAAKPTQKKGILTSKVSGKAYFNAWSMNVKFQKKGVCRHFDVMTCNHGSQVGNTPPWMFIDDSYLDSVPTECHDDFEKSRKSCSGKNGPPDCKPACKTASACVLIQKKNDKEQCCKPDNTGHHLVEVHCFLPAAARSGNNEFCNALEGLEKYDEQKAPCACASKDRDKGSHGVMHAVQGAIESAYYRIRQGEPLCSWEKAGNKIRGTSDRVDGESYWSYKESRDAGAKAHSLASPGSDCNEKCIKKQLDAYHKGECGIKEDDPVRSISNADSLSSGTLNPSQQGSLDSYVDSVKGLGIQGSGF